MFVFGDAPLAPSPVVTAEEERLKRLRKQMREQDARKHRDPTASAVNIIIVCAWRLKEPDPSKRKWEMVTWCRDPLTGHKVSQIRRRYSRKRRFSVHDPLTYIELRAFRAVGGCRGMAPPPLPVKRPRESRRKEAA